MLTVTILSNVFLATTIVSLKLLNLMGSVFTPLEYARFAPIVIGKVLKSWLLRQSLIVDRLEVEEVELQVEEVVSQYILSTMHLRQSLSLPFFNMFR